MNVSSDALNTRRTTMSTQETTTKTETANAKKAKATKKAAKKKAATPKKAGKATKGKGTAKSGSKAAIVLDLMKRKEGATEKRYRLHRGRVKRIIQGLEGKLPSIDPKTGILLGVQDPYLGPAVRFEPMMEPYFVPGVAQ
jgi:hypothetical protein